jgi:hypothetical protein
MALVFPTSPSIGDLYPPDPGVSGVSQYQYDGAKWNAVLPAVSLGIANQGAYNEYQWPAADGIPGRQLTTDGSGNLSWDVTAAPTLAVLSLLEPIDGNTFAFTLVLAGTSPPVFFSPVPSSNIVVFLGGVPQIPGAAYTVSGNTITFNEKPLTGSTFYAISSTVL